MSRNETTNFSGILIDAVETTKGQTFLSHLAICSLDTNNYQGKPRDEHLTFLFCTSDCCLSCSWTTTRKRQATARTFVVLFQTISFVNQTSFSRWARKGRSSLILYWRQRQRKWKKESLHRINRRNYHHLSALPRVSFSELLWTILVFVPNHLLPTVAILLEPRWKRDDSTVAIPLLSTGADLFEKKLLLSSKFFLREHRRGFSMQSLSFLSHFFLSRFHRIQTFTLVRREAQIVQRWNEQLSLSENEKRNWPATMWSGWISFFACCSQTPLACRDKRWMNSLQHWTKNSFASPETRIWGVQSLIILYTAARGTHLSSSSLPLPPTPPPPLFGEPIMI